MKILFYDTKNYDRESFDAIVKRYPEISIEYTRSDLDPRTAALAEGDRKSACRERVFILV